MPYLTRSTPTSDPVSIISPSPEISAESHKKKRKPTVLEPAQAHTPTTSTPWKRRKVTLEITPAKSTTQQPPQQSGQAPVQAVAATPIAPPKPFKLQAKFYAIGLSETKQRWAPKFDRSIMREGDAMRSRLTLKYYKNEKLRAHRQRMEAEKDDESPLATEFWSHTSPAKKPSDSRFAKLVAKAIRNAGATGTPITRPPLRSTTTAPRLRTRSVPVTKKQQIHVISPQKPKGILAQAEKRAKAVQRRICSQGLNNSWPGVKKEPCQHSICENGYPGDMVRKIKDEGSIARRL